MAIDNANKNAALRERAASCRGSFPLLSKKEASIIYLDNAATTLKPTPVVEALRQYYEEYPSNVHRASYPLSTRANQAYEDAREVARSFLGANEEDYDLIFCSGTTDAINLIASSYAQERELSDKSKAFVVSDFEHHSSYVPWQRCAHVLQKEFRTVGLDSQHGLDMQKLDDALKDAAVLSITGMSNVTGYVPPLEEILQQCRKHGTRMVLDAAQLAAHQKISLAELPVDAVCFSAHKLCGPTGIGVLCIRKEWLQKLPFLRVGGGTIRKVFKDHTQFLEGPEGYEAGTPHIAGAIGMAAGLQFIQELGFETIHTVGKELRDILLSELSKIDLFRIIGSHPDTEAPIISLVSEKMHSQDVSFLLDTKKICVRTGHLCAQPLLAHFSCEFVLRISAYLYNTREEVESLVQCFHSLQDILKRSRR